jgi:hypothetical protein
VHPETVGGAIGGLMGGFYGGYTVHGWLGSSRDYWVLGRREFSELRESWKAFNLSARLTLIETDPKATASNTSSARLNV